MGSICAVGSILDNVYFFADGRDAVKASKWLFKENELDAYLVYDNILDFYKERLEELNDQINVQKQMYNKQDEQILELLNDKLELEGLIKKEIAQNEG